MKASSSHHLQVQSIVLFSILFLIILGALPTGVRFEVHKQNDNHSTQILVKDRENKTRDSIEYNLSAPVRLYHTDTSSNRYITDVGLIHSDNDYLYHFNYRNTGYYGDSYYNLDVLNVNGSDVFSYQLLTESKFNFIVDKYIIGQDSDLYGVLIYSSSIYTVNFALVKVTVPDDIAQTSVYVTKVRSGINIPNRFDILEVNGEFFITLVYDSECHIYPVNDRTEFDAIEDPVVISFEPSSYQTFGIGPTDKGIATIQQIDNGSLLMNTYHTNLTLKTSKKLTTLGEKIGFDNLIIPVYYENRIDIFEFIDELFSDTYSRMDIESYNFDGNRIKKVEALATNITFSDLTFSKDGDIFVFDWENKRIHEISKNLDYLNEHEIPEPEEEIDFYQVDAVQLEDETVFLITSTNDRLYGFSLTTSDKQPSFGSIIISEDTEYKDEEIQIFGDLIVEEEADLVIENCVITEGISAYFKPYDYGVITNHGNLVLINSTIEVQLNNQNNLTLKGSLPDEELMTFQGGKVIVSDLTFDNMDIDRVDMPDYIFLSHPYSSSSSTPSKGSFVDYEFIDCTFKECYDILYGFGGEANFIDCSFTDCFGVITFDGDINFNSCEFYNCTDVIQSSGPIEPRSVTFASSEITNVGITLQSSYTDITVKDSTFKDCDRALDLSSVDLATVEANTFEDNNISIVYSGSNDDIYCTGNKFINDNVSIYYYASIDHTYFEFWDPEDEILRKHIDEFIDCRYNYWDTKDHKKVASKLSDGIYFLPYYTLDGEEVSTNDNDMDLMDDKWERENHLEPDYYYDRYMDPDKDRYSNYQEYKHGTDPYDQDSSPAFNYRVKSILIYALIFIVLFLLTLYAFYYRFSIRWRRNKGIVKKYPAFAAKKASSLPEKKTRPKFKHVSSVTVKTGSLPQAELSRPEDEQRSLPPAVKEPIRAEDEKELSGPEEEAKEPEQVPKKKRIKKSKKKRTKKKLEPKEPEAQKEVGQ